MMEWLAPLGVLGGLMLLVTGALLAAGIVLLVRAETSQPFRAYLALALVPALFGLTGTWLGLHRAELIMQSMSESRERELVVREARSLAMRGTQAGAVSSLPLLLIGAAGMLTRPSRRGEREGSRTGAHGDR